ncbi:Alpha-pyrone synthesis polyketide synthase-like Pks18 [Paenibacillus plantiphilus]|uniref:Alpha-pyrone synthesis polyketide synthase-like Pks18 n=1 Tax=Paenibacillus plantiphilus TaxID=2905650 RepID=A0ABN8GIZ9_9BACL|nr:type III polyketide synthase [Paenibacillus plantiphilus]CAH1208953.1 Alpha-pyrone synthesis polyketide synthase-like Pks18 [Paenibacillus plantiphilus]
MEHADPIVAILGIGTAVPNCRIDQEDASQRLCEALERYPVAARWAKRIFRQSGVHTRYTCDPDLLAPSASCRYLPHTTEGEIPTTSERMRTFKRESVPLGLEAARRAIRDSNVNTHDITHLITVSCTGQFLPGLDTSVAQQLGLAVTVNRIPLNFLGCAAGLKAISLAKGIVSAKPSAQVLIVCVELCTLHIQPSAEKEDLLASSFFGDGASACVVGSTAGLEAGHPVVFQLGDEHSVLLPDSAGQMVWEVGDHGFELYLSPEIPRRLGETIPLEVQRLLNDRAKPELWAIHPGGRGIVDTMQEMFELGEVQTRYSRNVLRNYGNLSSATILFVLDEMKRELVQTAYADCKSGIALAFGPGLTAEMMCFHYVPSTSGQVKGAYGAYA